MAGNEFLGKERDATHSGGVEHEPLGVTRQPPGVTVRGGTAVLVLAGEIDIEVVSAFRRARVPRRDEVTAVDAGGVTLLTAAAVQLLLDVRWAAALAGRPQVLVRSNPHVDRVLHLLGLTGAFPRAEPGSGRAG